MAGDHPTMKRILGGVQHYQTLGVMFFNSQTSAINLIFLIVFWRDWAWLRPTTVQHASQLWTVYPLTIIDHDQLILISRQTISRISNHQFSDIQYWLTKTIDYQTAALFVHIHLYRPQQTSIYNFQPQLIIANSPFLSIENHCWFYKQSLVIIYHSLVNICFSTIANYTFPNS